MKTEIILRVIDVARQTTEPAFAKARPDQRAGGDDEQADDHEPFSEIIHTNKESRKTGI